MTSFTYDGKSYEPLMTRAGVRSAEDQGFATSQFTEKPQTAAAFLFFASLFSKYKVNPAKAFSMFDDLLDSGTLDFEDTFTELMEAYSELFGSGGSKETTTRTEPTE